MVFADDERESNPTTFKFLQSVHAWSQAKKGANAAPLSGFTASSAPAVARDEDGASDVASSHGGDD